jgi:phospholipase/carboxylesterase
MPNTTKTFRFAPAAEHAARHLFVFLHGSGATANSMIPLAFRFQSRFPSAALVVPSGFRAAEADAHLQQWFPMRGLNDDNRLERVNAILPRLEDLVRREQAQHRVPPGRTVLIGYSQGGTVALETIKSIPDLAGAVVAYSARFARLPNTGASIGSRIHLVHGADDMIVSRVHAERAARVLAALHVPVTLDIVDQLGHLLSHQAASIGSLRLLQGIYEGRRATLH